MSQSPFPTAHTVSLKQSSIDALMAKLQTPEGKDADRLKTARLCRSIDRLRDADDHFTDLLGRHEDQAWLWLEAGRLSDSLGHAERAVSRLKNAAKDTGPIGIDALKALGIACLHAEDIAQAGRTYFKLWRQNPNDPTGLAGLVVCATLTRRPKLLLKTRMAFAQRFSSDQRASALGAIWVHAAAIDATHEIDRLLAPRTTTTATATATASSSSSSSSTPASALDTSSAESEALNQQENQQQAQPTASTSAGDSIQHNIAAQVRAETNPSHQHHLKTAAPPAPKNAGDFEQVLSWASQVMQQATVDTPERADNHYHLAMCENAMDNKDAAKDAAFNAIAINPHYERANQLAEQLTHNEPSTQDISQPEDAGDNSFTA